MTDAPDSTLLERIVSPVRRALRADSAGGLVLLVCAVAALVLANSPWSHAYASLWETRITLGVGQWQAELSLHSLIGDGLMAVFFFFVGLEIKREVLVGELATARQAALPVAAAIGGMVVPASLYLLLNAGGDGARGWGVPMATDIAFALGVLALVGDRVPASLRVFLAALAIVDDLGAVLAIALFYTSTVSWGALVVAAALLLLSLGANAAGVRAAWVYALIGVALWVAVLLSGVHATVAGVLLALTIPSRTRIDEEALMRGAQDALRDFHEGHKPGVTVLSNRAHQSALRRLESLTEQAQAPLARLEHGLTGIVAFGIMPLFAFANAGVSLQGIGTAWSNPIALGVVVGLVAGKPLGILLTAWLSVRAGLASLPTGVSWRMLGGVAMLAGIGFTMSLFIAGLAFDHSPALLASAKVGTLMASTIAGVAGWLLLRHSGRTPRELSSHPRTSEGLFPSP